MTQKFSLLWQAFIYLVQLERMSIDKNKLKEFEDIFDGSIESLKRMSGPLRLKITEKQLSYEEVAASDNVTIAVMKDGSYLLSGRGNERMLMTLDPADGSSRAMSREEFLQDWSGSCLCIRERLSLKTAQKNFGAAWFLPVIFRYKKYWLEVVLAAFFLQIIGIVMPLLTQVIIDKVLVNKGLSTLNVLGTGMLMAAIIQCGMGISRKYIEKHTACKADILLGSQMMHHLLSLPLRYFEVRRAGDTLTRVSAIASIREFLTGSMLTAILDTFFSVVFYAVMLYYSLWLTMLAMLPIPIYLLQNVLVMPVYRKRLQESWQAGAKCNAFMVEAVSGMQTIKALSAEEHFTSRWEQLQASNISTSYNASKLGLVIGTGTSSIQGVTALLVLLAGGHMVMNGDMTIGQLIAFQMLARQASEPIARLSGLWQQGQQTSLAAKRLEDIMNSRPEAIEGRIEDIGSPEIEFRHVSFGYDAEQEYIIKDVSFKIEAGTSVGIIGPSGSGKSTITKLLNKLYIPAEGEILINGVNIAEYNTRYLRSRMGVVQQENQIFHGTIRQNIAITNTTAAINQIAAAARLAGADSFISALRDGYETQLEENGENLSGGQRQRIAIARALLSNPKLLVFDEATSALDYRSESIIMHNLDSIAKGRTMLIVAHRLRTVKGCDKILVMDNGRLVESGSHQSLVDAGGIYSRLYKQQEAQK